MRDRNPANGANWTLECIRCDQVFDPQATVGVLAAHWSAFHPEEDPDKPQVELKWVGLGPAPKARP